MVGTFDVETSFANRGVARAFEEASGAAIELYPVR